MSVSNKPVEVFEYREDTLRGRIVAYIAETKIVASDGLTISEFAELLFGAVRLSVQGVEHVSGLTGPQKRELVQSVAGDIFDNLIMFCIPLPLKPVWWLVAPAARSLCVSLAGGLIEVLVPLLPKLDT